MFFNKKRKHENYVALLLSFLAFFAVGSAYIVVKLDASLNRPQAKLLEAEKVGEEKVEVHIATPAPVVAKSESETGEQSWLDAEATLGTYFANINAGNYAAAINMRNPDFFVGTKEAYVQQLSSSKENDISGDVSIDEVERLEAASSENKKVLRFHKACVWSFDQKIHNEIKKAYISLRDGEWQIDYFELERKY